MSGHPAPADSITFNAVPNDIWQNDPRINDLRTKRDEYVTALTRKTDKQLEKMLDTIQAQIGMAYKQRNEHGLAILQEEEDQVIEARSRKLD